jgi:tRNA threonylcarbamoyladenosine biosynthesis protein TsaB
MRVLALSLSASQSSLALAEEQHCHYKKVWTRSKSTGEVATLELKNALETCKDFKYEALAVDVGPGSFTGVRIAVSIAKTISFTQQIPLFSYSSLSILAESITRIDFEPERSLPVLAILNAYNGKAFVATYSAIKTKWVEKLEPQALTLKELEKKIRSPHICIGEGYNELSCGFTADFKQKLIRPFGVSDAPNAWILSQMCLRDSQKNQTLDWKTLNPLYIRASTAEEKLRN